MPEKNYVASTDLISRILHPIQRSLDEAMGTMGRSMDPDRLEESEKQQDRSSSRVPGTLSHGETASTVNDRAKPKSPAPLIHEKALDSRKSKNGTVYTEREALNTGAVIESDMVPSRLRSDSPPVIDQLRSPKKQEKPLSDRIHRSGRSVSGPLHDESLQAVPPQTVAKLEPSEAVETRQSKARPLIAKSVPGERKGRPPESPPYSINVPQAALVPVADSTEPGEIEHTEKIESLPKEAQKPAVIQRRPVGTPLQSEPASKGKLPDGVKMAQSVSAPVADSINTGKTEGAERTESAPQDSQASAVTGRHPEGIPLQTAPVARSDAPKGASPTDQHPESAAHQDPIKASGTVPAVSRADMPAPHRVHPDMRSVSEGIDPAQPAIEAKPGPGSTGSLQAPGTSSSQPDRIIPLARPIRRAADNVGTGMEPVLEQAYGVTRQSLQAQQESAAEGADSASVSRVNNTFNVNVSMSAGHAMTAEQREALKDALIDILRSAARRQGLEV